MNRIALVVCLILMMAVVSCGKKEEPAPSPPPPPQAQQTAPDTTPAPAADTMAMQKVAPEVKKDFKSIPGDFTIQVASWATLEEAEKLAEFYNGKGYEARVENADVEGGRWYRVRIGHYKNSGDAHEVATQIAEKYKSDIWLVRL